MTMERNETDDKGESLYSEKKLLVVGEIILSLRVFHLHIIFPLLKISPPPSPFLSSISSGG